MAMLKLGEKIVSARVVILILSFVLLIPAAYGYIKTRVNYDILSYLPKDIETMEGQDILVDQFGTGAFSLYVVEGMEDKDVSALKSKIENVDHVSKVIKQAVLPVRYVSGCRRYQEAVREGDPNIRTYSGYPE